MLHNKTNLILFDGLPGSGKTTTSQNLYGTLKEAGYRVQWFHEEDSLNPICHFAELVEATFSGPHALAELNRRMVGNWQKLGSQLNEGTEIMILEGMFFQCQLGLLLLMAWPEEKILVQMGQVMNAVRPLDPHLIYFYAQDVGQALDEIVQQRGQGFVQQLKFLQETPYGVANQMQDLGDVVKFLKRKRALSETLLEKFSETLNIDHMMIDKTDQQWSCYESQIYNFLVNDKFRRDI